MTEIKAHFDGRFIVPDEPADLRPGQAVIVRIESSPPTAAEGPHPGSAKGELWLADDFDAPLEDFKPHME